MACRDSADWIFTLDEDFSWASGVPVEDGMVFKDKSRTIRLKIARDGTITIPKGYSWDGCTPKVCFFHLILGVPDGVVDSRTRKPKTYYASLVHDALYQFQKEGSPYSRAQADKFFLRLMGETGFYWRYVYYVSVRLFGGFFGWLGRNIRGHEGMRVLATDLPTEKRAGDAD